MEKELGEGGIAHCNDNNSGIESNDRHKEETQEIILNLLYKASCLITRGFYNRAIKDSLRVLELEADNENAKAFICLSLIEMKDIDSAEQFLPSNKSLNAYFEAKKKEAALLQMTYPSSMKYLLFYRTLYMSNAYFPKIDIKCSSDDYRSVVSKAPISKSEIIMCIPLSCLITLDLALSIPIGRKIATFMYLELNSPKHCLLASFLLNEAYNPKWQFYFNVLPANFSHFPMNYTDNELKLLEKTAFINQLNEKKKEMRNDYDSIVSFISSFSSFSFEQFCQARLLISSRVFGVKINGKKTDVLAPYADLLNHNKVQQTHWYYDDALQSFIIQAKDDIPQGVEIFDSYGHKGNARFLMYYGFVLQDNDFNDYPLTVSFNSTCPFFKEKELWIKNAFEYEKTFVISKSIATSSVIDLFSFLRFVFFKEEDLQLLYSAINVGQSVPWNDDVIPSFYYIHPLSVENERDALDGLREICLKELNAYPTTMKEDRELLEKAVLSFNERNCVILRLSEKKVLQFYVDFCEDCVELLGLSKKDIINIIMKDPHYAFYEEYIEDVILVLSKRSSK